MRQRPNFTETPEKCAPARSVPSWTLVILGASANHLGGAVIVVLVYALPVVALVVAALRLRGAMRIFWMGLIVAGTWFIPLIGIIISIGFLVFKGRFVDWQRSSWRLPSKPKRTE